MDEQIKERIIQINRRFGLNTEFITDENILGYALGKTIYINGSIEQDYERTNMHELLHFFEETEEFEAIKQELFEKNKADIEAIREEYKLRYYGLYSEKEIEAGVLDNEIAIDLMVENSSIEYEEWLKVEERLLGNIEHNLEEKRYLNLQFDNKIKSMNLSPWEKIFVSNYYDNKERKLPQGKGKEKTDGIREDIEAYLQELYDKGKAEFIIDSNSPEIIREYESEIKALQTRGEDTNYLKQNKERALEELASKYSEQLYEEYKHIVDLIKGKEYEPAFKCMMLRETLTKTYKLETEQEKGEDKTKTIVKKRMPHQSIAGHMVLNETTLDFIYKHAEDMEQYPNFANLYFASVEVFKKTIAKTSGIKIEGVETYGKGSWIKFDGKNTNEEEYLENAKRLSALVQDTPWCTKTLASSQLAQGDFYVFVDKEGKPHIAVKMSGDEIDEVRGLKNGNAQELEEEYRDVAISFLTENREIKNGKEWLEKEEWNKRLIEYKKKIDVGEFTKEDVPQFIEDYFRADYRSHGGENTNKTALKERLEKARGVIADYYECEEEEICLGDVDFSTTEFKVVPYKVIFGNADFEASEVEDLGQLQSIGGNAYFANSQVENLGQLQRIGGYANFYDFKVENLGHLQSIGGSANFSNSKVEELGELKSIGESAYFEDSQVKDLGQLQSIGGSAYFKNSQVENLGKLQSIGGYAYFTDSKVKYLGELQTIGENANFRYSKVEDLGQLRNIGGDADFSNSKVEDLGHLQSIGENAYFEGSEVKKLCQLQSIGGFANFYNSKVEDLGQLQSIGEHANFAYSQVQYLGELQSIGGNADFRCSQVKDLGELQIIGGFADFEGSKVKDLGELQSIGGNAYFANSQVENLGKLRSIGEDADFENFKVENLGNLQSIGGNAYFVGSEIKDLGLLRSIGGYANFAGSQVTDLGQLQSIGGNAYWGEKAELKAQYDAIQEKLKRAKLTGQAIGMAGFGTDIEECERAEAFLAREMAKEEKEDTQNE